VTPTILSIIRGPGKDRLGLGPHGLYLRNSGSACQLAHLCKSNLFADLATAAGSGGEGANVLCTWECMSAERRAEQCVHGSYTGYTWSHLGSHFLTHTSTADLRRSSLTEVRVAHLFLMTRGWRDPKFRYPVRFCRLGALGPLPPFHI
jgi:hypothetical protein